MQADFSCFLTIYNLSTAVRWEDVTTQSNTGSRNLILDPAGRFNPSVDSNRAIGRSRPSYRDSSATAALDGWWRRV